MDHSETSLHSSYVLFILTNVFEVVVRGDYDVLGTNHSHGSILVIKHEGLMLSPFLEMSYLKVFSFLNIIETNSLLISVAVPVGLFIFPVDVLEVINDISGFTRSSRTINPEVELLEISF